MTGDAPYIRARMFASKHAMFVEGPGVLVTGEGGTILPEKSAFTLSYLLDRVNYMQTVQSIFRVVQGRLPHNPAVVDVVVGEDIGYIRDALGPDLGNLQTGGIRAAFEGERIIGYLASSVYTPPS